MRSNAQLKRTPQPAKRTSAKVKRVEAQVERVGAQVKTYPEHRETERTVLDPNNSIAKMIEMVGERKRVLDLGCASGYVARLLTQRECDVVGVDVNPTAVEAARAYCTKAFVADLDATALADVVGGDTFDVILCGDVLEHLRQPLRLLEEARALLRDGGYLVASIPNIAHGAIRLALLDGSFDYQEFGILDDTHLRFFTSKTVDELFVCAGYRVDRIERTTLGLFEPSDLVPHLVAEHYAPELLDQIRSDPEHQTLQFVVRASALQGEVASRTLVKRFLTANTELSAARLRVERLGGELRAAQESLARLTPVLDDERRIRTETQAALADVTEQLARSENERARLTALAETRLATEAALAEVTEQLARSEAERTRLAADTEAQLEAARRQAESVDRDLLEQLERSETERRRVAEEARATVAGLEEALRAERRTLETIRAELETTSRLNAGLVAELRSTLDAPKVAPAVREELARTREELESTRDEVARGREELERTRADLERECGRYAELSERFARYVESAIDRAREETGEIASAIDLIQTGRIWRLKGWLRRLAGRA